VFFYCQEISSTKKVALKKRIFIKSIFKKKNHLKKVSFKKSIFLNKNLRKYTEKYRESCDDSIFAGGWRSSPSGNV